MSVTPVKDTDIFNAMFRRGFKMDSYTETLTAAKTITVDYPPVLILDPNGASQNVDLPAEADSEGLWFFIVNAGAATESLVVRNDAAATITTISQPENGFVYCDGTSWYGWLSKGDT